MKSYYNKGGDKDGGQRKTFVENIKKINTLLKHPNVLYIKISKHQFNRNITRAVLDRLHMILCRGIYKRCAERLLSGIHVLAVRVIDLTLLQ